CPCGESFENAETYLQHRRLHGTYQKEEHVISTTPSSNQRALEFYSGAGSVSAAGDRPIPPAEAKKIQCPCGKSFANKKALNKHLRYSKTHQPGKPMSASDFKATTPGSVPFTAPRSPPTLISLASDPVVGTSPSSLLSLASLFPCTCGHAFETQRVLDLHKRDCLYHKRQANQSLARNEQSDDFLVSSFASLNLESVSTRARPSVDSFACMCGRVFTNENALEQHKQDARRLAWSGKGKRREKIFKTPRPQYQEDDYLRDLAAVLAQQHCS
ncbi:hypothetical protein EJ02DRAFT_299452, partial [Clathrospora elynae]